MNPLAPRKQLLLAESELNRAQLVIDMAEVTISVRTLIARAKGIGVFTSVTAALVAGVTAFQGDKPVEAEAKPSWIKTAIKGAGLISTLWLAFRRRPR
ncbi:MAG: hypothetical protein WCO56_04365 [Verrucomicrobiota bacterium]